MIGDDDNAVVFEFDPQVQAGAETLLGPSRSGPAPGGPMTGAPTAYGAGLADAKRVVVKVGSSSLTTADGRHRRRAAAGRSSTRSPRRAAAVSSSCSSPRARSPPGWRRWASSRPRDLARQQAAASVGQGLLMHRYTAAFADHGIRVGQVLLTVDDVTRRGHYRNAYRTFAKLLELGVLPVVNENDTVATTEIRFGDNDRLAALVAHLVHADALVLLSDVDGVYDRDPQRPAGARASRSIRGDDEIARRGRLGRGGALGHRGDDDQARGGADRDRRGHPRRRRRGPSRSVQVLAGGEAGTWFAPTGKRRSTRQLWLAHATEAHGAARPRRRRGAGGDDPRDLAAAGWRRRRPGRVRRGRSGRPRRRRRARSIARGLVNYDAEPRCRPCWAGPPASWRRSSGDGYERELVHRDDLVLL